MTHRPQTPIPITISEANENMYFLVKTSIQFHKAFASRRHNKALEVLFQNLLTDCGKNTSDKRRF